jgi:hypothetical protein
MAQKGFQDEWGTGAREGYEDRGTFRPPRAQQRERGSPLLRTMGVIATVGGICWGTYLVTATGGSIAALQENHGPVAIIGLGLVALILGKFLRG